MPARKSGDADVGGQDPAGLEVALVDDLEQRGCAIAGYAEEGGRLGPEVEGDRAWLTRWGYTPGTVGNMLKDPAGP